ncbi:MAG: antiviral reverse transcriptase Drt3b [Leptospiraceae bacterium]|nr:antiviral reverse transcriptase Drt3b [Leptospiraceae bacterium]
MSKKKIYKIDKSNHYRSLLTEVIPFETPIQFSNWGAFNYLNNIKVNVNNRPKILTGIFGENSNQKWSIPYQYRIKKDLYDHRYLALVHPKISNILAEFYRDFDTMIAKTCHRSEFSIRAPIGIAKLFISKKGSKNISNNIEQLDETQSYASSYFTYKYFTHLFKFYESDIYSGLENKFSYLSRLDVNKFFGSIYTHSIAWATKGKLKAKELLETNKEIEKNFFANKFDSMMQWMNYNETNGIVIGPEVSRIFSEIIMQAVDVNLEKALDKLGLKLNVDYFISRYVDDFLVFYNNTETLNKIKSCLKIELEIFKLYLNNEKSLTFSRPFITVESQKKIELSSHINNLFNSFLITKSIDSGKEINKIRVILSRHPESNHSITNFFISSLSNNLYRIKDYEDKLFVDSLLAIISIAFHVLKNDIRVSGVYRIIHFVITILGILKSKSKEISKRIKDKIFSEIIVCLNSAINSQSIIEAMNLLTIIKDLDNNYLLPPSTIDRIIEASLHDSKIDNIGKRLSYFEIVNIFYYIENNANYAEQRNKLLNYSASIFDQCDFTKYAESAYLLLDLIACPYLTFAERKSIAESATRINKISISYPDDLNFIKKHSWFFNWNSKKKLKKLLKKKDYMPSY